MTINFEDYFKRYLENQLTNDQIKIDVDAPLGVYLGMSKDGCVRLSFMSSKSGPLLDSTKLLRVIQGEESDGIFWTCFDLLDQNAINAFYSFCNSLVEAVCSTFTEERALAALKKRFIVWKALLGNTSKNKPSQEVLQGLFGELLFLKTYMADNYGIDESVEAWSGPDLTSKDFSVKDTWYEIKTVGANSDKVKISSLTQLASDIPGRLIVVKVERMSPEFGGDFSDILSLAESISDSISNEGTYNAFISKLEKLGFDIFSDDFANIKFDVKSITHYYVDNAFPRLTSEYIGFEEIVGAEYYISIPAIKKYEEK